MKSAGSSVGSVRWLIAATLVAGVIYSCKKDKGGDGGNPCPQGVSGYPTPMATYGGATGAYPTPVATYGLNLLAGPGYNDTIAPMMASKCATAGCHVGGTVGKSADLTNYNNVKTRAATANSKISGGSMPPSTSGLTLSATDKSNFASWVSNNYPLDGSSGSLTPVPTGLSTPGAYPTTVGGTPGAYPTYASTSPTNGVINPDCLPKPAVSGTLNAALTPVYPGAGATPYPTGGSLTPVPTYGTTPTFGLLIK